MENKTKTSRYIRVVYYFMHTAFFGSVLSAVPLIANIKKHEIVTLLSILMIFIVALSLHRVVYPMLANSECDDQKYVDKIDRIYYFTLVIWIALLIAHSVALCAHALDYNSNWFNRRG
jgi:DMSO reductase anchor subunit